MVFIVGGDGNELVAEESIVDVDKYLPACSCSAT